MDKDSLLTGRLCQSYNDPHMTTFDGKTYHYMDIGEYVLYRNDKGPYWVKFLQNNWILQLYIFRLDLINDYPHFPSETTKSLKMCSFILVNYISCHIHVCYKKCL